MDLLFDQLVESDKVMKAEAAEVSIKFVFFMYISCLSNAMP